MKGKLLDAYIKSWRDRCEDGILHDTNVMRDFHIAHGMTPENADAYTAERVLDRQFALAVAEQFAPHFPRHCIQYGGEMTILDYVDRRDGFKEWRPCAHWMRSGATFSNLDHPNARRIVNQALAIRGIDARIGWRNGQPTVTEGFRVEQTPMSTTYQIFKA